MTPALPSAPGRPREPGFPCNKVHEIEKNWRVSLYQVGQNLLKHGMHARNLDDLKGEIQLQTKPKNFIQTPKDCVEETF